MRTYLDCYPCFLRQALEAARFAGATGEQQAEVLQETLEMLKDIDPSTVPPEIGDRIHRRVREMVADSDPYNEVKRAATDEALKLRPWMRATIAGSQDPLETAVRLAIAGNIIDYGHNPDYDLEATIAMAAQSPLDVNDMGALRSALTRTQEEGDGILYIGDNAGETVFDRALVEILDLDVTYAVKGAPVLNDATLEDAKQAGLDECAALVSTGADTPGTILSRTSEAFQRMFAEAKVIIAKGQANYETLSPGDERIFFLLMAKCPVIARDLGVETGGLIVKQGHPEGDPVEVWMAC